VRRTLLACAGAAALLACTGQIGAVQEPVELLPDGGFGLGSDAGADAGPDAGTVGWDASVPDAGACPLPLSGEGTALAPGLSYPRHLAGSAARLFATEVGVLNKPLGRVLAVDPDGGVTELATDRSSPDAITTDGTSLFFVDEGGLWRFTLPSGPLVSLDTKVNGALQGTTSLALAGSQVLYATGQRFLELSKINGSGNRTLFQGAMGSVDSGAAVSGGFGYFLYSGAADAGLYQVSLSGSPNPQLVSDVPVDGTSLTVTGDAFYWTRGGGDAGMVQRLARDGGEIVTVAAGLAGPRGVIPWDGGYTYFQDSTAGQGDTPWFFQAATPCTDAPVPVGPSGQGPGDLLYDADAGVMFFTSYGGAGSGYVGRVP
jgi:hypothetical protein